MAYLGNDLQVAFPVYRNIDDISGSFNNVLTTFPLTVSGVAPIPAPLYSQQCLISVGGVVQRPDDSGTEGFRLSGSNIIFASAPTTGADFFGVILAGADYINAGANFPSGSAAVPSITFDSDLDTGIYNSGANQVSITTSGTERLRIDSAGQIESVSLGTAAAPAFSFTTDANTGIYSPGADQVAISTNGTGRLFVDASGNVCLKKEPTNPNYSKALTVVATDAAIALRANSTGTYTDQGIFFAVDGVNYSQIYNDGIGQLIFRTGSGLSERLRITSAGLVGVGTSSPSNDLDVLKTASGSTTTARIGATATSGANNATLILNNGGTGNATLRFDYEGSTNRASIGVLASDQKLTFGTAGSTAMTIDASQRLGIGTTSPSELLHLSKSSGSTYILQTNGTATTYLGPDSSNTGLWGTSTNHDIRFMNNNTERVRIDTSGRMLVGTSTHSGLNASGYTGLNAYFANTGDTGISLSRFQNTTNSPSLQFLKSRGTSVGSLTVVSSGDDLGEIVFSGADGDEFRAGASITAQVDNTPGNNDMPGRLVFSTTADGASSPTERMRIAQNGVITIQNGAVAVIGTLTDGATITPDFAADCNFTVTLGGNRTIANPTNITAGQSGSIFIVQDGTGSRTLSWGSYWDFPGGTAPTLSTAANAVDRIDYIVRSSTSIHTVFTANYS